MESQRKRPTQKEVLSEIQLIEPNLKADLNSFMGRFGIKEIQFGSHSLKKTSGKEAKSVIKPKSKK